MASRLPSTLSTVGESANAAALFFACAYTSLGFFGHLWLPLRRTLLLLLPMSLAWPAFIWEADFAPRLAAAFAFVASYSVYGVVLKLLPAVEISEIMRIASVRGRRSSTGRTT